jgi:hypothetical protein
MRIDMLTPELVWLEDVLFEESAVPLRVLAQFHPLIRIPIIAYEAADIVATELVKRRGTNALDLYTPEIRRYEETALVGLGGMVI